MNRSSPLRRLANNRSGASALEFALVLPVLITMMVATFEVGRYYFTVQAVRTLTAEAIRVAMLPAYPTNSNIVLNGELITSCTASNTVTAAVVTRTPFINNSQLTVCVGSNYATATPGTLATIRIAAWYPFSSPLPFVSWLDGNITDQTKVVLRKV